MLRCETGYFVAEAGLNQRAQVARIALFNLPGPAQIDPNPLLANCSFHSTSE